MNQEVIQYFMEELEKISLDKSGRAIGKDFLAGIDPTGGKTFEYAMRDYEQGSPHRQRARLVGTAGGVVGGGLVVPTVGSGLAHGIKSYFQTKGPLAKRLAASGAGFVEGLKMPVKAVGSAFGAKKALGIAQSKGVRALSPKDLQSIRGAIQYTPLKRLSNLSDPVLRGGLGVIPKRYLGAVREQIGQQLSAGLTGLGTGALIGGGSAYLQYGKGQQASQRYLGGGR